MDPYNLKLWTVPPTDMGWYWMGDFVPVLDPSTILRGALFPADAAVGLNAHFYYAPGGSSTLSGALAARSGPIHYGRRLVQIDPRAHQARFADGSAVGYDQLVSTLPLTTLGRMLGPLPEPVRAAWRRLEAVDLVLVDVGFKNAAPCRDHWIYFPDPDVLAYRAHAVHALSPEMMPSGHGLFCLEISHSRHRPLPPGDLKRRMVDDLVRTGWIASAADVVFVRERRFANSYVLPRVGFKQDAARVRAHALLHDIRSIGRYGEWKYCNQEDALVDGRRAALELAGAAGSLATDPA
jgi:protoporphyrinogen oxidase